MLRQCGAGLQLIDWPAITFLIDERSRCNFACQTLQICVASHNKDSCPQKIWQENALQGFASATPYLVWFLSGKRRDLPDTQHFVGQAPRKAS